jgi:DNA mismatch endonuclease (patch repair protein)
VVLAKHKTVIFVHGCFWHRHKGCKNCTTPTNRREWWLAKLNGNAARDKLHQVALGKLGWRVIVIWECEAESQKELLRLASRIRQSGRYSTRSR